MKLLAVFLLIFYMVPNTQAVHKEIMPNVYTVYAGSFTVSMFVVTSDSVFAIEPVDSATANMSVAAIRNVTNKPITHLFISHNHWDHSSGAKVFKDAGVSKIVAHRNAYNYLKVYKHRDTYMPNDIWDGAYTEYKIGNVTLELHHFGPSHGHGMTIFRVKEYRLAYIADLGLPKQFFFSGMPDYDITGLMHTMKKIVELDFEHAVFAHQNGLDGGTRKDSIETLQMLNDINDGLDEKIAEGVFPPLIQLPLSKYVNWTNFADWGPLNVQRLMFWKHMGPFLKVDDNSTDTNNNSSSLKMCNILILFSIAVKFIFNFM